MKATQVNSRRDNGTEHEGTLTDETTYIHGTIVHKGKSYPVEEAKKHFPEEVEKALSKTTEYIIKNHIS